MVYRKNWKWSIWYISNGLQKKLFIEKNWFVCADYVKINELHDVHMTYHAIWLDEITGVIISIKKVNKNLNILKK